MKKYLNILIILAIAMTTSACEKLSMSRMDIYKLNQKADEYMQQGDYENAIMRLVCINDLEDTHPEIHYNLGVAYIKKEEYEKAIESLNNAIKLNPEMKDAYFSRGVAYEMLTDKKIEELDEVKEDDKKTAIKNQISQNLNFIYENYAKYSEFYPQGAQKKEIMQQFDYLKDKYKDYLKPVSPVILEN